MLRTQRLPTARARAVPVEATESATERALAPRAVEQLLRIKGDLGLGLPVVLQDGREQTLVALVESLTEERYRVMASLGAPELALTLRRVEAIGVAWPEGSEVLRLAVPDTADLAWLAAVAGRGRIDGLFDALAGTHFQSGSAVQTAAIRLAKSTQKIPAALTVPFTGDAAAAGLMTMSLRELNAALDEARQQERVSSAPLPMAVAQAGRVHVFRPDDGGVEHYAIEVGSPDLSGPVSVRLHSACFTGDVLGSLKCDCGPQLRAAMTAMAAGNGGVLLYLNQEGRGIGLANKMRAYVLQDAGLDTVEANHWLGFEDDQRDFRVGASILEQLGVSRVRLMTNNPAKVSILTGHGIEVVERLPLQVGCTEHNAHYLATKARKSGHLL
ncbi:MAG: GTP cyclohydrolase II [Halieaceae bacterium]|jgi:GTP cyclohydrolase II|nr:GTP cyclohydrolase II [Halieaceae bacterium]